MMSKTVLISVLLCGLVHNVSSQCQDIDTQACVLLEQNDPAMCQSAGVATAACPQYCNRCPLSCYHCDAAVTDFKSQCNSTMQCSVGQQCMLRHLKSTSDGHHEYAAGCVNADMCDAGVAFTFGRRRGNRRNVAISCCDTDLCNSPFSTPSTTSTKTTSTVATTTTTTITTTTSSVCMRDILIFVEDASVGFGLFNHDDDLLQFLESVVTDLDIGMNAALVEVATFDTAVYTKFDLNAHTTKYSLTNAIRNIRLNHHTNNVDITDVTNYIEHSAFSSRNGDRPNAPNDIIIIVDHAGNVNRQLTSFQQHLVEKHSGNIIVINIDWHSTFFNQGGDAVPVISHLATDSQHTLTVNGYTYLRNIKDKVVALLCS